MSLRPYPVGAVPEETAGVAHAAFPHGNLYVTLRDTLGTIFSDADFAALFPPCGQPALSPWRLALVTGPDQGTQDTCGKKFPLTARPLGSIKKSTLISQNPRR